MREFLWICFIFIIPWGAIGCIVVWAHFYHYLIEVDGTIITSSGEFEDWSHRNHRNCAVFHVIIETRFGVKELVYLDLLGSNNKVQYLPYKGEQIRIFTTRRGKFAYLGD